MSTRHPVFPPPHPAPTPLPPLRLSPKYQSAPLVDGSAFRACRHNNLDSGPVSDPNRPQTYSYPKNWSIVASHMSSGLVSSTVRHKARGSEEHAVDSVAVAYMHVIGPMGRLADQPARPTGGSRWAPRRLPGWGGWFGKSQPEGFDRRRLLSPAFGGLIAGGRIEQSPAAGAIADEIGNPSR